MLIFECRLVKWVIIVVNAMCLSWPSVADDDKVLRLYHDADWSNHIESAESIWRGVEVALSEVDHNIQGYRIELVKKNHSGNVVRSLRNIKSFIEDKKALAVISGIHSPPLIKNRQFINEQKILTLVPWAAGGPITRHPSPENWVFRLSVDDTKAGGVLVNYALDNKACNKPHLLLENSPWGKSNLQNMTTALMRRNYPEPSVTRFSWGIKAYTASSILQDIVTQDADCILLVANALEGSVFANAMSVLESSKRLPIISHWGITAGDFHEKVNASTRKMIDLSFIQSCFSFNQEPLSIKGREVLQRAQNIFSDDIKTPQDIRSPVGFIHAYDLTRLLLAALQNVVLVDDMAENRTGIRVALESIKQPVEGLVKVYKQPFGVYSESNKDAHEALGGQDYCMAYYNDNDDIVVHSKTL